MTSRSPWAPTTLIRRNALGARLLGLASLSRNVSFLEKWGWFRSFGGHMAVDRAGKPIPWFTYPAISFLRPRVKPDMAIFEYGSGNSTMWWSSRVARIVSCEHDEQWGAFMRSRVPGNVECHIQPLGNGTAYVDTIRAYPGAFDIVVVDGRERVACTRAAPDALKPAGVVLWDNSDRAEFREAFDFLIESGFRRLDFWGPGPVNPYEWCTSVFYRDGNCLGI